MLVAGQVTGETATARLAALKDALRMPAPATPQAAPPLDPQTGERGIFDGVSASRPFEATTTIATNVIERATGVRDQRYGAAATHGLLAGERLVVSLLRYVAEGRGVVAAGSSVLGKVLPLLNIGNGALDVWTGWKELADRSDGPLSLLHSKTAREGLLGIAAGVSLLIPGWGAMLVGAAFAGLSVANDLDVFHALDAPTVPIEAQGTAAARIAHPLDRTPTIAFDPARAPAVSTATQFVATRGRGTASTPLPTT
jgi:hypothetical protein